MAKHLQCNPPAQGLAAVEFCLVLPLLLLLLAFPLYFGRSCYHYSVAQAAATSAATFMSKAPLGDMINTTKAPTALAVAKQIVQEMTAELNPGPSKPFVAVDCVQHNCAGNFKPNVVRVSVEMTVDDIFFRDVTQLSLPIYVSITLPYLGR